MKTKLLLSLILLIAYTSNLQAQNVGIGTSSPASKLDVEGGVSIGTTYSGATAAPANGAIIEGAVGIGTSAPGAKVEIIGLGATSATANLHVKNAAAKSMMYLQDDGRVGFGSNQITSFYTSTKMLLASQYGGESDLVIRTADSIPFNSVPWLVFQNSRGTLSTPTIIPNGTSSGSIYGQGFDGVSFQSNAYIDLGIDGVTGLNDMPGRISFGTTLDGTNSPVERMRINNAGNVGIGTSIPAFRLEVQQDMTMDSDVTAAQFAISGAANNGKRMIFGYDTNGNGFGFIKSGNYGVTWTPIALQPNGGLVGIGITNPTENLSVRNTGSPAIFSASNDNDHFFGVYSGSPGDQHVALIADNGQAMRFGQWGNLTAKSPWTERMRIDVNGNVGIGNAAPAYKLDVTGDVNFSSSLRFGGVPVIFNAPTDVYANIRVIQNNSTTLQDGMYVNYNSTGGAAAHLRLFANGTNERMRINANNGNVGIGTTSSANRLYVLDNTGAAMRLESSAAESDIYFVAPSGAWEVGTNASGNGTSGNQFYLYNGGYRLTLQNGTGNVGVGTTAPSERLQVSGGQLYASSWANQNWGNTGIFFENFLGIGDLSFQSGTYSYSIRAEYGTIGDWFACYSDNRIKKDIRPLAGREALNLLNKVELKHYKYIDFAMHGTKERIGVIAQQVESVFPEAISTLKNFIPNVYQVATNVSFNEGAKSLTLTTETPCDCKVGDKVRIYADKDDEPKELEVIAVNEKSFTLAGWQTETPRQIFVYGKEVPDFRGVDYDRIFLLGMAAIQELDSKITDLEKLKAEVEAIKAEVNLIKKR